MSRLLWMWQVVYQGLVLPPVLSLSLVSEKFLIMMMIRWYLVVLVQVMVMMIRWYLVVLVQVMVVMIRWYLVLLVQQYLFFVKPEIYSL